MAQWQHEVQLTGGYGDDDDGFETLNKLDVGGRQMSFADRLLTFRRRQTNVSAANGANRNASRGCVLQLTFSDRIVSINVD
jgi:hypothetical protein